MLQIPTPRWTTYDAKKLGVAPPSVGPGHGAGARLDLADLVHADRGGHAKDAPSGTTVADLKGKGAVALDDAQLKQLVVGQDPRVRNTVTGQRFEILYGTTGGG